MRCPLPAVDEPAPPVRLKKPCAGCRLALTLHHRIEPGCTSRHPRFPFQAPGCFGPEPEGARHFPKIHSKPFIAIGGRLMSRVRHYLSTLPDCDDALRRLADVLQVPATCRKSACRRAERCRAAMARRAISSGASSSPMRCWTTCPSIGRAGPNGAEASKPCSAEGSSRVLRYPGRSAATIQIV